MKNTMKILNPVSIARLFIVLGMGFVSVACEQEMQNAHGVHHDDHAGEAVDHARGEHGGKLFRDGDFRLELLLSEAGIAPEYRAWTSYMGEPLPPAEVQLEVSLARLSDNPDDRFETVHFSADSDMLRGDRVIDEPHSFTVLVKAAYLGKKYQWQYENIEGRTRIESAVADALEIKTLVAGPVVLQKTIDVYGRIKADTERQRNVSARFPGVVKSVLVSVGDTVKRGQVLATVESNASLKLYNIKAPIKGVITQRMISAGEQTTADKLFVITDTSSVWVDLSVYPLQQSMVKQGDLVSFSVTGKGETYQEKISMINVVAENNLSLTARLEMDNADGKLLPGSYVSAKIKIDEAPVLLAVKRSALQTFRNFTVVYARVGDQYEVRMLTLGQQDDEWVEVLSGLKAGTTYVSENSYVIKADIEKAGAAHAH